MKKAIVLFITFFILNFTYGCDVLSYKNKYDELNNKYATLERSYRESINRVRILERENKEMKELLSKFEDEFEKKENFRRRMFGK